MSRDAPRDRKNNNPITRARLAKNMTQGELASALGVKAPMISQWENGARKPKLQSIMKIAQILDVNWQDLVENLPE